MSAPHVENTLSFGPTEVLCVDDILSQRSMTRNMLGVRECRLFCEGECCQKNPDGDPGRVVPCFRDAYAAMPFIQGAPQTDELRLALFDWHFSQREATEAERAAGITDIPPHNSEIAIRALRDRRPDLPIFVLTGVSTYDTAHIRPILALPKLDGLLFKGLDIDRHREAVMRALRRAKAGVPLLATEVVFSDHEPPLVANAFLEQHDPNFMPPAVSDLSPPISHTRTRQVMEQFLAGKFRS